MSTSAIAQRRFCGSESHHAGQGEAVEPSISPDHRERENLLIVMHFFIQKSTSVKFKQISVQNESKTNANSEPIKKVQNILFFVSKNPTPLAIGLKTHTHVLGVAACSAPSGARAPYTAASCCGATC